jgi:hypothetical protein
MTCLKPLSIEQFQISSMPSKLSLVVWSADSAPQVWSPAGFSFLAAKYGGRTSGWWLGANTPTRGSPSVFCSQKREPWSPGLSSGVPFACGQTAIIKQHSIFETTVHVTGRAEGASQKSDNSAGTLKLFLLLREVSAPVFWRKRSDSIVIEV